MIHLLQNIISFWIGNIFRVRHINSNLAIILLICQTGDKILIDFSDIGLGTKGHVLFSVRCRLVDLIPSLLSVYSYSLWPNLNLLRSVTVSYSLLFFAWSDIAYHIWKSLDGLGPCLKSESNSQFLPWKIFSDTAIEVLCSLNILGSLVED